MSEDFIAQEELQLKHKMFQLLTEANKLLGKQRVDDILNIGKQFSHVKYRDFKNIKSQAESILNDFCHKNDSVLALVLIFLFAAITAEHSTEDLLSLNKLYKEMLHIHTSSPYKLLVSQLFSVYLLKSPQTEENLDFISIQEEVYDTLVILQDKKLLNILNNRMQKSMFKLTCASSDQLMYFLKRVHFFSAHEKVIESVKKRSKECLIALFSLFTRTEAVKAVLKTLEAVFL